MKAKIIDGKELATKIKLELKEQINLLSEKWIIPGLAVILVGDDSASSTYVRNKEKACEAMGIHSEVVKLAANTSQEELHKCIKYFNDKKEIHGVIVQLPLPKHLDEQAAISMIAPEKDVDGLTLKNIGALYSNTDGFIPCTPLGIIEMLKSTGISLEGKHAIVVGRSNLVGKPISALLLAKNATVTICHSKTANLAKICSTGDILITAIGKPRFFTKEFIKPGAIVVDVGTSYINGKLYGDCCFEECAEVADYISPVPGGVGQMTVTMLLKNTIKAAKNIQQVN